MSNRSWKTTVTGILSALVLLANAALSLLDGDPTTNPDLANLVAGLVAAIGLILAKDADKSGLPTK